jgi:predicted RNase H-like HicB family nuclease
MEKSIKIIIEKHADGFTAYPLGLKGAVVGWGLTETEALTNIRSAILFHVETFGPDVFGMGSMEMNSIAVEASLTL